MEDKIVETYDNQTKIRQYVQDSEVDTLFLGQWHFAVSPCIRLYPFRSHGQVAASLVSVHWMGFRCCQY